ncbi:MAG: hypothetical protein J2P28_05155 [Actinobacteria bacterium]|nr:hypothetical protein [Actinomycetota bacterium]MBO0834895.1 hypothetical protein [Actinomycetota bacterium]
MSFDERHAGARRWPPAHGGGPGHRLGSDLGVGEVRRLGKPGAYRLGELRAKGVPGRRPPRLFRARFVRRRDHRWSMGVWLLGVLAAVAVIALAAAAGWWFVPLLVGLGAGVATRTGGWPPRVALAAVAVMAMVGWGLPFWLGIGPGNPGGALSRVTGSLTGLPGHAAGVVALTVLIAIVQAVAGYVIGHALTRRALTDQLR